MRLAKAKADANVLNEDLYKKIIEVLQKDAEVKKFDDWIERRYTPETLLRQLDGIAAVHAEEIVHAYGLYHASSATSP
ncbi:hypothetical protein PsorP6_010245 [Peronosclerospora sorghi]|uniref:Uncharacterized protein n=1 Tax=Peronosclerospora sorghi TaxID=230839 RepID=A0ACC0VUN7_9STRA|nr:hypothetical protein PsorP6_010245 [Peronosclerospora sorghi]